MKIYIDTEFKCHADNFDGTFQEVETSYFEGMCRTMIEGYRFVPSGEKWIRDDGVKFSGKMITPWKDYSELDSAQRKYERAKLAQYEQELPQAYLDGINSI